MARTTGTSSPRCFSIICVETEATTETISFPGFISGLISSRISRTAWGFTASNMMSASRTAARLSVDAVIPNCLASDARLLRVAHGGVHALRLHELLLQKRAQQNPADLSGAQHGQPLIRKFVRKCRFHGACIVDDAKPSVNIRSFLVLSCETWNELGVEALPVNRAARRAALRARAAASSATASSDSTAPRGLPGKLTISARPRTPATPRDSAARGFFFRPYSRITSGIPGSNFWQASVVASGVESLGPIPVPPVVRTSSAAPPSASETSFSRMDTGSSGRTPSETTSQPSCAQRSRSAGPEASARMPRERNR